MIFNRRYPLRGIGPIWLVALPALTFVLGMFSERLVLPLYGSTSSYDYDPAYVYLLNGISLALGGSSAYYDHPGTPVQIGIGAIAQLWWSLFGNPTLGLLEHALFDPEQYIKIVGRAFLLLNAACVWVLGRAVVQSAKSVPSALVAQCGPLFLGTLAPHLLYVSAEAVVLGSSALLCAALAPLMVTRDAIVTVERAIVAGLVAGVGVSAKVTFAPMVLLLCLIPSLRHLAAAVLAVAVAALVCVLPIHEHLGAVVRWLSKLVMLGGQYGTGAPGLPSLKAIGDNLARIGTVLPLVYLGFIVSALGIRRHSRPPLVFCLVYAAHFLLAAKFGEPRYFIALVPLSTVVLAWLIWSTRSRLGTEIAVALFAACAGIAWSAIGLRMLRLDRNARVSEVRELERFVNLYPGALVIGAYRVPERTYAINFALGYSSPAMKLAGANLFGADISYHSKGTFVWAAAGPGPASGLDYYLRDGRTVLLVFPRSIPFSDFECEEPILRVVHFHACRVLRVIEHS